MPDPGSENGRRFLVGGAGRVRFAVPLEAVVRVRERDALPPCRREVNVPILFDLAPAPPAEDRYAEIVGLGEPAFLRLGRDVRTEEVADGDLVLLPEALKTTAARWGWAGLVASAGGVTVVLDAPALARLGGPRGTDGGEA